MNDKMYPTGTGALIGAADVETSPTFTDLIETVPSSGTGTKGISLRNLFGSMDEFHFAATTVTATGSSIGIRNNFVLINNATPATPMTVTLATPSVGRLVIIGQLNTGTATTTVTLATGTYDGTNGNATFNAQGETLALIGLSTTRFAIIGNVQSVGLS